MKYGLVIFDLGGTLLNTIEDLGAAVNHALSLRGLPVHAPEEYPAMVGHGIRNLIVNALTCDYRHDDSFVDSVLADFKDWYSAHIDVHTRPYPGMTSLLGRLQADGSLLAVASNKFQSGTEALVRKFFPEIRFTAVFGNSPDSPLKPDPALVKAILDRAGCAESEAVLVGDSATDILTAHNGGIAAIAVTWGYRPAADLTAADYSADSPDALEKLLRGSARRP